MSRPHASGGQSATVTGGGLSWSLVARKNTQYGTSEVWKATAAAALSSVSVTSTLHVSAHQTLTVVGYSGSAGVGASASASAGTGASTVGLTTTGAGSLVLGVGNDLGLQHGADSGVGSEHGARVRGAVGG